MIPCNHRGQKAINKKCLLSKQEEEPADVQEDVNSNMKNEAGRLPSSTRCQNIH